MKRLLLASVVVIILAVRLVQLVREPGEQATLNGTLRRAQIVLGTGTLTARVDVPTDTPVEMGLPAWTELLTPMPSSPPPIDTRPPTAPAAALR